MFPDYTLRNASLKYIGINIILIGFGCLPVLDITQVYKAITVSFYVPLKAIHTPHFLVGSGRNGI